MKKPELTSENFKKAVFESINVGPLEFLTPVDHHGNTLITDRRVVGFRDAFLGVITPGGLLQTRCEKARTLIVRAYQEHKSETTESQYHNRFVAAFRDN